jgi:uncharacterized protein YjbI with pentapeptide repeats
MDNTTILDELFATARTYESALAIALRACDEMMAVEASTRLREVLGRAVLAIETTAIDSALHRKTLRDMYLNSTIGMNQLVRRVPSGTTHLDAGRLRRWAAASAETKVPRGGPHLFEFDSHGRDLQEALFFGLHVAHSKFLTDLRSAMFVDTFIERSDFAYAKLDRAILQRTCIRHSFFRDASFKNTVLDDVAFFDCDLRDADLSFSSSIRGAAATTAQFIRCDLRGARCLGRDLSAVDFIGCQVHGMASDTRARSISRADVSENGDGSWVMGVC